MGDVHHRSCFEKTVLLFGRALGFEHIISIFGLTEYVHHTTIEGIGVIAALVVERVPQTAADVLARSTAEYIVTGERITGSGIVLCLDEHSLFSPVACHTAGGVVRVPVVYIISPLAGEIGYFRVEAFDGPVLVRIGRMSEEYRIYLMSPCFAVATGVAIRIRVFLIDNIEGIFGEVCRIPGFIQDRFP